MCQSLFFVCACAVSDNTGRRGIAERTANGANTGSIRIICQTMAKMSFEYVAQLCVGGHAATYIGGTLRDKHGLCWYRHSFSIFKMLDGFCKEKATVVLALMDVS